MPNYIWYLVLVIISFGLFIPSLLKTRYKKVLALYFFIAGGIYLFEYIILVLLNSYVYYPAVLKNSYFDNVLGAVVSNAFIVPMSAVFTAVFQLKGTFLYLIATAITGIQVFFLYLGIYKDHWWNTLYTWLGLVFAFKLTKFWFNQLTHSPDRFIRYITLFCANLTIGAGFVFILVALFNTYFYNVNWFANETRSHVAFATFYIILISLTLTTLIVYKAKWHLVLISLIFFQTVDYLLYQNDYLKLHNWRLEYFLLLRIAYYLCLLYIDKYWLNDKACNN